MRAADVLIIYKLMRVLVYRKFYHPYPVVFKYYPKVLFQAVCYLTWLLPKSCFFLQFLGVWDSGDSKKYYELPTITYCMSNLNRYVATLLDINRSTMVGISPTIVTSQYTNLMECCLANRGPRFS